MGCLFLFCKAKMNKSLEKWIAASPQDSTAHSYLQPNSTCDITEILHCFHQITGDLKQLPPDCTFFCATYNKQHSLVNPKVSFGKGAAMQTCECWSQDPHKHQTHYSKVPNCVYLFILHSCHHFLLESHDSGRADTKMVHTQKANGFWGIVCCPITRALVQVLLLASMKVGSSLLISGLCCK